MLCNRLAIDLLGELKMRAVSGIVGFGAMAIGTPTTPGSTGDGARLKVTEFGDLLEQSGSVVNNRRQWVWHGASLTYSITYFKNQGPKKENLQSITFMSHTLGLVYLCALRLLLNRRRSRLHILRLYWIRRRIHHGPG